MCAICGCGGDNPGGRTGAHDSRRAAHHHDHHHNHDHIHAAGAALDETNLVEIERDLLSKNDRFAAANRDRLAHDRVLALNLVSSPGAGKTSLLVETVGSLRGKMPVGVIEGDQETSNDAERILATGVDAVQINTGRGCHLDAHMVGHALDDLPSLAGGVVFIENVGNLVCPAAFDLGEAAKVVILSVTEGDDKPLKYPDMFAAAQMMILSKIDLLPHVDFDPDRALERARRINPNLDCLRLSVRSGDGMTAWFDWIEQRAAAVGGSPRTTGRDACPVTKGEAHRHA